MSTVLTAAGRRPSLVLDLRRSGRRGAQQASVDSWTGLPRCRTCLEPQRHQYFSLLKNSWHVSHRSSSSDLSVRIARVRISLRWKPRSFGLGRLTNEKADHDCQIGSQRYTLQGVRDTAVVRGQGPGPRHYRWLGYSLSLVSGRSERAWITVVTPRQDKTRQSCSAIRSASLAEWGTHPQC